MLDLLLGDTSFLFLLIGLAILSPVLCLVVLRFCSPRLRRPWIAAGLAGPLALSLWFAYLGMIAVLGFATVVSVIAALLMGVVPGVALGFWVRGEE